TADADGADAEQGHVLHDVLAPKQAELAAGENLRPVLEPDRQVHLAHVDLRASLDAPIEVRSRVPPKLVVSGAVVDLRREPEVDGEVHSGFLAARLERGEGGKEPSPN